MNISNLGLTRGLNGSVGDFHQEVQKLTRPYHPITKTQFDGLMEAEFDYYLNKSNVVVTFGEADGGYALMPLNAKESEKLIFENGIASCDPADLSSKNIGVVLAALRHFQNAVEAGDDLSYLKDIVDLDSIEHRDIDPLCEVINTQGFAGL
jgi:hypothetical protein